VQEAFLWKVLLKKRGERIMLLPLRLEVAATCSMRVWLGIDIRVVHLQGRDLLVCHDLSMYIILKVLFFYPSIPPYSPKQGGEILPNVDAHMSHPRQ